MSRLGVLVEPILVGREKELEELQSIFNWVVERKGKTVFIIGDAGTGKTRIAREFLNSVAKQGAVVMVGWCLSDAQVPYFPFIEAFDNYYSQYIDEENFATPAQAHSEMGIGVQASTGINVGEQEIMSWLTGPKTFEATTKPELLSPQVWKDKAFAAIAKSLRQIAVQAPVVLFLEDIHWADSASLALLHYISRVVHDSEKVLILATFRSEELTNDAEGHPHPLADTLRMMRREELFTEIRLQNLDQKSVSRMAEHMIGGTLQTELAEKLATESKGNPLFVVETLRMLLERKSLFQEKNQWRLAVDELGIPSKIKDIILRRLSCLKYAQRRVLDAASVIGEEFDVELLSTVLGQDSLEILEILDIAAHSTSLVRIVENRYRFDHARSRETLYEELSPPLRRGYHNRIAEKLENTSGAALSDLAYHYALAGNKEKAIKYALAAGKDELGKWSNAQAIKHFQYVLQNVGDVDTEEKRTALEGLGDAYAASYMYAEAIKTFEELAACAKSSVKLRAFRKASDAAFAKGDVPDLLVEYAKKTEEIGVDNRLEMARIIDNRGHAWAFSRRVGERRGPEDYKRELAEYQAALRVFEEENSIADTAEALRRSGLLSVTFENMREKGLGQLLRSVAIFTELGDVRKEMVATLNLGEGFSGAWLFQEERRAYAEVLRIGEKLGTFDELALASMYLSGFDEDEGNLAEAIFHSQKALEYSMKTDANYIQGTIYAVLTRRYSLIGDLKNADEYFDKLKTLQSEMYSPDFTIQNGIASGVYFAAKAQWEKSNQIFGHIKEAYEEMDENFRKGILCSEASWREGYAWALQKQGRLAEAKAQRDIIQRMFAQIDEEVKSRFEHANVELSAMMPRNVQFRDKFELRLDLVNVGKKSSKVTKIADVIPPDFKLADLSCSCIKKNNCIEMNDNNIDGFQVKTIKLKLEPTKAGTYSMIPEVFYMDDLGATKSFTANPITITVQPRQPKYQVLPGRIPTGSEDLDALLLGGIPQNCAIALTAASTDERELLIKRFLEAGTTAEEMTFYITAEAENAKALVEKYPPNFYLFVCNSQADAIIQDSPNIFKLKGLENLTDIDIALTKAFRKLNPTEKGVKRICVEILSDVLLQHHALNTRRWLSALLPTLKSKGFTVLAAVDPQMHPPEELQAVLGVFDGEIRVSEKETPEGIRQILRVRKLVNQKYQENEVSLTKEKLSS